MFKSVKVAEENKIKEKSYLYAADQPSKFCLICTKQTITPSSNLSYINESAFRVKLT